MKGLYADYIKERNIEGSNKAASYIRALDLLDELLNKNQIFGHTGLWSIETVSEVEKLYEYALRRQRENGSEFLQPDLPPSYGRNGYYSASLKSYIDFLISIQHESRLWELYDEPGINPSELSKQIERMEISSIEVLVRERNVDFASKEGKEVLRETKARVNQSFFRKMVLSSYDTRCCVSGLNLPEVLRASHIVAWSDDQDNRMNPANGLCLSATYDAAFDRHLISFDEDYRMIFSPVLKEYYTNEGFKKQFANFEGEKISLPKRYCPDQAFLERHRKKLAS